ncbi:fucolectin-like [Gigantopelta aegis]|uniref:fucolectin-like n=1 Tax=Gigantopelta aegis TaxID=1735272 RepID=UPI001B888791|nr:fucolectin-like [Gigantopelta aegis]
MKLFWVTLLIIVAVGTAYGANVAQGANARQSSTWKKMYTADQAVDGNTGKVFFQDTCTHTNCKDKNPHWTVCLGEKHTINSVTIHNPDKAHGRLKNIKIEVFETDPSKPGAVAQPCATIGSTPVAAGIAVTVTCPINTRGQYIRISKTVTSWHNYKCDALLLCEVDVDGTPYADCPKGFQRNQDSCYLFADDSVESWFEARIACQTMGADLVVIDSQSENDFIRSVLDAGDQNCKYIP